MLLLCLEQDQEQKSLEAHTRAFLYVASLMDFPDCSLHAFYLASLNERTKALLPGVRSFIEFVEWVLVSNVSPFTICSAKDELTSPTLTPAPPEARHHRQMTRRRYTCPL